MPEQNCFSLRLVVQRIADNAREKSRYKLIAYGSEGNYHPVQFDSVAEVVKVLHKALPDFTSASLRPENESSGGSIIFAELMELTHAQLSLLGLRRS
jgi:hypothetical protein